MGSEHLPLPVPHHQDSGPHVTDHPGHLLQRPLVLLSGVEKPPARVVLQLQVAVDEVEGSIVQRGTVPLKYRNKKLLHLKMSQCGPCLG